jgi:hypothetical protein
MEICSAEQPPKFPRSGGGEAACWLLQEGQAASANSNAAPIHPNKSKLAVPEEKR